MANYCYNDIVLRGDKEKLDQLIRAIEEHASAEAEGKKVTGFLGTIMPEPDYSAEIEVPDEYKDEPNWYWWRAKHWGTVYEIVDTSYSRKDDYTLELSFISIYWAPDRVYHALEEHWGINVEAVWHVDFCTAGIFENGIESIFKVFTLEDIETLPDKLRDTYDFEDWLTICYTTPPTNESEQNLKQIPLQDGGTEGERPF